MRWASVAVGFLASASLAAPKTVIIAGDCSDPALISGAKDFRDTAARLLGDGLMEPESVLDIVRPRPTRSVQDVERQVDSAKALFYGGQPDRARELVERALLELERASPEAKPWPITQQALVLLALIHKGADRPKDMAEAFKKLVRLDPSFRLDPDAHPPSAIAALDAVKKELARARKTPLTVRVESGAAAQVYIDGQPMGPTPLKLDVPPGTYRVSLTAPGMLSFPHRIEVPRDAKLSIDLDFEGSVGQQAPLCLLAGADDAAALKLGQLVTAERLIVLRNTARQGAPPTITGALFELGTGHQARVGTVRMEGLGNLAVFLVTGKEQVGIITVPVAKPPPPAEPVKPAPTFDAPVAKAEPAPALTPAAEPPPPPVIDVRTKPAPGGARIASFTLLGVGAASAIAGVVLYASAGEDRRRLTAITRSDGKLPQASLPVGQEAFALMRSLDANQAVSFTLIGVGVGAAAAGALGLWLFPATSVAVTPTPGGGAVTLSGAF